MTQEALKLALDYLESRGLAWNVQIALREALRENAMREVQRLGQEIEQEPVTTLEDLEQEIYENTRQFVSHDVMEWMLKRYYTTPPQQEPVAWEQFYFDIGKPQLTYPPQQGKEPVKYSDYEPDGVHHNKPPQQEERNFCQRCGKRTKDIHTCTPPQD